MGGNRIESHGRSTYNRAAHIHVLAMKSNITLKLDAELLREAKILAAEENTSISQLLTDQLQHVVERRKLYERAKRRALKLLEKGYDWNWKPPASRDELHER